MSPFQEWRNDDVIFSFVFGFHHSDGVHKGVLNPEKERLLEKLERQFVIWARGQVFWGLRIEGVRRAWEYFGSAVMLCFLFFFLSTRQARTNVLLVLVAFSPSFLTRVRV